MKAGAIIGVVLALGGCARPGCDSAVTVQLLFGRSLHGGGLISDADWRDFLATAITPRFPDGLTVWEGRGQWRSPGGAIISEPSDIVEIVVPPTPDPLPRLEAIRNEYRQLFAQDSVGLVLNTSCASF